MISLIGGRYNGMYLDRDPMPQGSTVVIMDGSEKPSDAEVYQMRDGCAYATGRSNVAWDSVARSTEVRH